MEQQVWHDADTLTVPKRHAQRIFLSHLVDRAYATRRRRRHPPGQRRLVTIGFVEGEDVSAPDARACRALR